MTTSLDELHFESPPINEVVCGLMFEPLQELMAPHFGILWERYKPAFSNCKEQPPLLPRLETVDGTTKEAEFQISDTPPLPRIWFEESEGNGLIQVQRDRFHYNWRRRSINDEYPHFDQVFALFKEKLETFRTFVGEIRSENLDINQLEITYVNHIEISTEWNPVADLGNVFSDFSWKQNEGRLRPDSVNWRISFLLPSGEGRLHVTVRSATRVADSKPILLFDLTARGVGEDRTSEGIDKWFNNSHNQIVRAFVDLTSPKMREEVWRLKK